MKKSLLLGSALIAAISAFPQSTPLKSMGMVDMADKIARKFANLYNPVETTSPATQNVSGSTILPSEPAVNLRSASTTAFATWSKIGGSMNVYGVVLGNSKPLQYNDDLGAITFVHRKSSTYAPSPTPATTGAATGAIVTLISTNLGQTWDSTCVWNDDNNWARYPQGAILNPIGNTSIANASIVVAGPITTANSNLGWVGTYHAVKQLGPGTYNSTAASMTFVANSSPYTGLGRKADFSYEFAATDNGTTWSLSQIFDGSIMGTTAASQDYRGARLIKEDFTSGTFVFSHDSIIPNVRPNVVSGGRHLIATPGMAWSENGLTGYVYHIGAREPFGSANDTADANRGYQPIVHKTMDGGISWQPIVNINFNDPAMAPVMNHIVSTNTNSNIAIPFVDLTEGMSATVDRNGKLHMVMAFWSTFSHHPDTVTGIIQNTNYDGERYLHLHVPGARPYVYDFTGDGTSDWTVTLIDSLPSEAPGELSTEDGFASNPWDQGGTSGTQKVAVEARYQVSRTPDGANIIYTWAETDSLLNTTPSGSYLKWNNAPNVKARLMEISASGTMTLSPTEINITRMVGANGQLNTNVAQRAFNHYAAPTSILGACNGNSIVINMPVTITNSPAQLEQANPVNHWFSVVPLTFQSAICLPDGINENNSVISNSVIYPNPANGHATLAIDLKNNTKLEISVMNIMGQTVKTIKTEGQMGNNTINIDLNGLSKGVYLVNIKAENTISAKKLAVE